MHNIMRATVFVTTLLATVVGLVAATPAPVVVVPRDPSPVEMAARQCCTITKTGAHCLRCI
jgi:hypothetical protein